MARTRVAKLAFNRGLASRLGMARADIKRLQMASEIQTNWICRVLGSMMIRPGLGHLGSTLDDKKAFGIPFVFSTTDKADLELTDLAMRVWINDAAVERVAVDTVIANGTFDVNLAGWTSADEAGAVSAWQAGGYMGLTGNSTAYAIRRQQLVLTAADKLKQHALHIVIERGPVVLRVGTAAGDDSLINETELGTGVHSLAVTPNGANIWVEFKSRLERIVLVDSCEIEAAGDLVIETPWVEADLPKIRFDQSGDIIFVACNGYQQRKIERRATASWSVVLYEPEDGPFRTENTGTTTLTVSALTGNVTLTASKPVFRLTQVGALFQHVSVGQRVEKEVTAQNVFSDPIRITGVGSDRIFTIVVTALTGTGSTVTLQRSLDAPGTWLDVAGETYVVDTTKTLDDGLDNQIVYYRIGVKTGNYAGGVIESALSIGTGSITGVVRITGYTSSTVVSAEVLSAIGSLEATDQWSEGEWSDYRGYPTSVSFHEGRLGWSGRDAVLLSISDAFDGFDPNFEGDAGPISRTIGAGPVDTIEWMLSLQRLLLGAQGAEFSVRSSSLDEPLTPTNFNLKAASTQGSASVAAVRVDQSGIFVQRGGQRVYELSFGANGIDYEATHLSALVPEIGSPQIVKLVVQRQPDTRVHCLRSDGTVAMLVFDKVEQVIAWLEIETDGVVEDAVIMPGAPGELEDLVYYYVKRTINGATKRFKEKWAFESECQTDANGDAPQLCKIADSFISYTGAATTTVSAPHLAGEEVVIWADGVDVGTADDGTLTYTLDASGNATLPDAVTNYVVGLPYSAPWKSARLVELMGDAGGSLTDHTTVKSISLVLADIHAKGVKYGQSLDESSMRDLPDFDDGGPVDPDAVRADYETEPLVVDGTWSTDARLCLLAKAPRPATVLACIAEVEHHGG